MPPVHMPSKQTGCNIGRKLTGRNTPCSRPRWCSTRRCGIRTVSADSGGVEHRRQPVGRTRKTHRTSEASGEQGHGAHERVHRTAVAPMPTDLTAQLRVLVEASSATALWRRFGQFVSALCDARQCRSHTVTPSRTVHLTSSRIIALSSCVAPHHRTTPQLTRRHS